MSHDRKVTLYHAPNTRSSGVLTLLEALQADYDVRLLNFANAEHKQAAFLAINPMGKVPTIKHGETVVTEQVAIYLYLADLYADRGLAPQMGDPLRGEYLRWMVFYGSCFEPAIMDRANNITPTNEGSSPYGNFDTMYQTLCQQLDNGEYMVGNNFTAADVLWGSALGWITQFKLIPENDNIMAYVKRVTSHEAFQRSHKLDEQWAAEG